MATPLWCEIVCDHCAAQGPGEFAFGYKLPRSRLKTEARAAGWKFDNTESISCPKCVRAGYHNRNEGSFDRVD